MKSHDCHMTPLPPLYLHQHLSGGEACAVQFTERVEDSCANLSLSTKQFRKSLK